MPKPEFLEGNTTKEGYLPDELPAAMDLSSDLKYLLNGYTNESYRRSIAMEYVQHLRARYEPGVYSLNEPEYASSQILTRLYIDMMIMNARRHSYHWASMHLNGRKTSETMGALEDLISAKIDLQKDISEYIALNPDKTSLSLFGNLTQLMHLSRRDLFGDEVTSEKDREEDLNRIAAVLAEHKVLNALQSQWPQTTLASVEGDTRGTDIVIPFYHLNQKRKTGVALQVKSSRKETYRFGIIDEEVPVPIVKVPMDTVNNDPFQLSTEQNLVLIDFVDKALPRRFAFA